MITVNSDSAKLGVYGLERPRCTECGKFLMGWIEHNHTFCECGKEYTVKWFGRKLVIVTENNESNISSHS